MYSQIAILVALALTLQFNSAIGQAPDTGKDFNQQNPDTSKFFDNPKIAGLASTIIPGMGQIYNKKFWKAPIIRGAGLALYSYYDYNRNFFRRFQDSYNRLNGNIPVSDPEMNQFTPDQTRYYMDKYKRHQDKALFYLGALYVANIINAVVDAHLMHFDISNDLTMYWSPTLIETNPFQVKFKSYAMGANIRFSF